MGDLSGPDTRDRCPSNLSTIKTPNGEICAGGLEGRGTMHHAIGVCRAKKAHVCTHNDMMQLAAFGNPWSGSNNGWYGDHGKAPGGNWDDEYGTWNRGRYDANNDGPAYHAGVCFRNGGSNTMHQALKHCKESFKAHVCEH